MYNASFLSSYISVQNNPNNRHKHQQRSFGLLDARTPRAAPTSPSKANLLNFVSPDFEADLGEEALQGDVEPVEEVTIA